VSKENRRKLSSKAGSSDKGIGIDRDLGREENKTSSGDILTTGLKIYPKTLKKGGFQESGLRPKC